MRFKIQMSDTSSVHREIFPKNCGDSSRPLTSLNLSQLNSVRGTVYRFPVVSDIQNPFPCAEAMLGIIEGWRLAGIEVVLILRETITVAHYLLVMIPKAHLGESP